MTPLFLLPIVTAAIRRCPNVESASGVFISDFQSGVPLRGFIVCNRRDTPLPLPMTIGGSRCVSETDQSDRSRYEQVLSLIITTCVSDRIYFDRLRDRISLNDAGQPLVFSKRSDEHIGMTFEASVNDLRRLRLPALLYVELLPEEASQIRLPALPAGGRAFAVTFYEHVTGFLLRRDSNLPLQALVRGYPHVDSGVHPDGRTWYFLTYNGGHVAVTVSELARDQCVQCVEHISDPQELAVPPCGHAMHKRCIAEWLELSADCPTCGEPLPDTFHLLVSRNH